MTGRLIVIGGNDGAGKNTQGKLLAEALNARQTTHFLSFPLYDTYWGKMIGRYLKKPQYGEPLPEELASDPLLASMLYELDRLDALPQMREWLKRGDWIVCDRYTESNLAHQSVKLPTTEEQIAFLEKLLLIQDMLGLLKADLTIILSLPQDIRDRRVETRRQSDGRGNGQVSLVDRHEQDQPYMERVNGFYPFLAERFDWPVINCAPDSRQLSVEKIGQLIWDIVKVRFELESILPSSR